MIEIPLSNAFDQFKFRIDIDNKTYGMNICWNAEDETWQLVLLDNEENHILSVQLEANIFLTEHIINDRKPTGDFLLFDSGGSDSPNRDGFSSRWRLYYYTRDEIDAIQSTI